MSKDSFQIGDSAIVEREHFGSLFRVLADRGYEIVGPTVREGAIAYERVSSTNDLPRGWTDEQEGGKYRLKRREDEALFGYAVGPHSWKKFYYPSVERLYKVKLNSDGFRIIPEPKDSKKYALIGVRACELRAISIQDKVFTGGQYVDPVYKMRRSNLFIVAVNCGVAGGTCFCASMGTGPKASAGYDLALTEMLADGRHCFFVEVGSDSGADVLDEIPSRRAARDDRLAADRILNETSQKMGRTMDASGLKELLYRNYEHPQWDNVATRCLTCANCTMVCPTCFCTTVEDVTDLTGEHAERWRKWDSCFAMDFSYIHGGSVRATTKSRYRQWMTHKLATWIDQFGESGCVGCGRCITWCPVGIDITEEVRAIRESHLAAGGTP